MLYSNCRCRFSEMDKWPERSANVEPDCCRSPESEGRERSFQTAVAEKFTRVTINNATMDLLKHLETKNITGIPQQLPQLGTAQQLQLGYQGYGPQEQTEDDEEL